MFGTQFNHYLSYGATDQQTVRELAGDYDGLLVPGTVASFQREGTGGFVLSLSALDDPPSYVIDPRFPLFQQGLSRPKQSHTALAGLLGDIGLVSTIAPQPTDFTDERIDAIARAWAEFNLGYQTSAGGKFAKYAKRLGVAVQPANSQAPSYVLAPYFMAGSVSDPWWTISNDLHSATTRHVGGRVPTIRVVAGVSTASFGELLAATDEPEVAIWVSALEELTAGSVALAQYGQAIRDAASTGRRCFALYGGFFAVLLGTVGLAGASHGIGFGEYRNWVELPDSGPPPARYYLPQLHRYVQPDEAAQLYAANRRLAECQCDQCNGEPPLRLDYHALMKHSVRCRAAEIADWTQMDPGSAADRLSEEAEEFRSILRESGLPDIAVRRVEQRARHINEWVDALRSL